MALIRAIECDGVDCGKLLKAESKDFFTVMGNIMIGQEGGVVGNNLDDDCKVSSAVYFCIDCFKQMINDACSSVANTRETRLDRAIKAGV